MPAPTTTRSLLTGGLSTLTTILSAGAQPRHPDLGSGMAVEVRPGMGEQPSARPSPSCQRTEPDGSALRARSLGPAQAPLGRLVTPRGCGSSPAPTSFGNAFDHPGFPDRISGQCRPSRDD